MVIKPIQISLILVLGIILIFWVGDMFLGIPAKVSDRAIAGGWAEDSVGYKSELANSRFRSLLYAIPAIIVLVIMERYYRRKTP